MITKYSDMWNERRNDYILVKRRPGARFPYKIVLAETLGRIIIEDGEETLLQLFEKMKDAGVRVMSEDEFDAKYEALGPPDF